MTVGAKIRYVRERIGLSQAELGEKLGMSADMIQKYENGQRTPKQSRMNDIAAALGVDPSALQATDIDDASHVIHYLMDLKDMYDLDLRLNEKDGSLSLVFDRKLIDDIRLQNYLMAWYYRLQSQKDEALTFDRIFHNVDDYKFPADVDKVLTSDEEEVMPIMEKMAQGARDQHFRTFGQLAEFLMEQRKKGDVLCYSTIKREAVEMLAEISQMTVLEFRLGDYLDEGNTEFARFLATLLYLKEENIDVRHAMTVHADGAIYLAFMVLIPQYGALMDYLSGKEVDLHAHDYAFDQYIAKRRELGHERRDQESEIVEKIRQGKIKLTKPIREEIGEHSKRHPFKWNTFVPLDTFTSDVTEDQPQS